MPEAAKPSTGELVRATEQVRLSGRHSLAQSVKFVADHAQALSVYEFVDDLALDAYEDDVPDRKLDRRDANALVHHLTIIRSAIARVVWTRQLFVGVSVLDQILFDAVRRRDSDGPIAAVFRTIVDRELYHPGIIVYPLHGFGVLRSGLVHAITGQHLTLLAEEFGFALTPQTNSINKTIDFLNECCIELGIRKAVPEELLEHWDRSRPAKWMSRNPLLVARTSTVPGDYYENQFLLAGRLRVVTTFLLMLSTLQTDESERAEVLFSSAMVNNQETLDIKHYMVLSDVPYNAEALEGQFVPMNASRLAMAELSDLPVEFHPDHWVENVDEARAVFRALDYLYEHELGSSFGPDADTRDARVYRKLARALVYFHRSFSESHERWQSVVSLAIAFETLLTDSFASGVRHRVVRRVSLLLRDDHDCTALSRSVERLYAVRGRLMHGEDVGDPGELLAAQHAFTRTFVVLIDRLPERLPSAWPDAPLRDICGDHDERSGWWRATDTVRYRVKALASRVRRRRQTLG